MTRCFVLACVSVASVLLSASGAAAGTPLSTEFTYQGALSSAGSAFSGLADFQFRMYDDEFGGAQIGATILIKNVPVDRGLFTVPLDFGASALNGENRWIEIDVQTPSGGGGFSTLSGRQRISATPYALQTRGLFTDSVLRVGVGTTQPLARLNVDGDLRVDNGELLLYQAGAPRLYTANAASAIVTQSTGSASYVAAMGSSVDRSGFVELRTPAGVLTALLEGDDDNSDNELRIGSLRLRSEGAGAGGGLISVANNDGRETFTVIGGQSASAGTVGVFGATGAAPTVVLRGDTFNLGGSLGTYSSTGAVQFLAEPDFDGNGGFVFVGRSVSAFEPGVFIDGNTGGSNSASVGIVGTSAGISLDASTVGDSSAVLPPNSINASEMLNEPGVANIRVTSVALGSDVAAITSRSITVPGPGYVVAFAQGDLQIVHVAGVSSNCNFGVSESAISLPTDQDVQVQIPGTAAAGLYDYPAPAHGLFAVPSAGTYTYFFNAARTIGGVSGSAIMFDVQLTLMYFPTSYGNVVSNLTNPASPAYHVNGSAAEAMWPLDGNQIAAEREAEIMRHNASVAQEIAQMRAQMSQMQARMNQIVAQQASIRPKQSAPEATKAPSQPNLIIPASATNSK
jgi:hypothetical protein